MDILEILEFIQQTYYQEQIKYLVFWLIWIFMPYFYLYAHCNLLSHSNITQNKNLRQYFHSKLRGLSWSGEMEAAIAAILKVQV